MEVWRRYDVTCGREAGNRDFCSLSNCSHIQTSARLSGSLLTPDGRKRNRRRCGRGPTLYAPDSVMSGS
ncbi:unnamed protein product [Merluccius merluccius]